MADGTPVEGSNSSRELTTSEIGPRRSAPGGARRIWNGVVRPTPQSEDGGALEGEERDDDVEEGITNSTIAGTDDFPPGLDGTRS